MRPIPQRQVLLVRSETFDAIEEGRKTQFSFPAKLLLDGVRPSEFVIRAFLPIVDLVRSPPAPHDPALRSRVLVGPKFGYIEYFRRLRDLEDIAMLNEGIQLSRFGFWFDDSFEPKRSIREAFELYWARETGEDFNPLTIVHTVFGFEKGL